jgi:hypothetical protein
MGKGFLFFRDYRRGDANNSGWGSEASSAEKSPKKRNVFNINIKINFNCLIWSLYDITKLLIPVVPIDKLFESRLIQSKTTSKSKSILPFLTGAMEFREKSIKDSQALP